MSKFSTSTAFLSSTHLSDFEVLGRCCLEDFLVSEATLSGLDVLLLAHLEVLAEVLVTAPPVHMDHVEALGTANLMEVGISHIVLDTIDWHPSVTIQGAVSLVDLTDSPAPVVAHLLLLVLHHDVEEEAAPQVEDDEAPNEAHAVLIMETFSLPVGIAEWVFEEAGDVLERSPFLRVVTGLLGLVHELSKVTISVLSESSKEKEKVNMWNDGHIFTTYLPIMSARSLILGTP